MCVLWYCMHIIIYIVYMYIYIYVYRYIYIYHNMCSMRQHFSKPATLQARRFTLAAGRLAPFAYPVASGWPARVIKHGNGKWTICTYKCYIYIYIYLCVCVSVCDFALKTSIHRGFSVAMFDYLRVKQMTRLQPTIS